MYTFYYPENGEKLFESKEMEFKTNELAIGWWKDKRQSWDDITQPNKEPAFIHPGTGEIVVVREVNHE